jgi:hypothetical protein
MVAGTCKFVFEIIIPKDPIATPYFTSISTGVHTHLPPPPNGPREKDIK